MSNAKAILAIGCFLLLGVATLTAAKAQSVGDEISVPFVCVSQAEIEKQIDALYKAKSSDAANVLLAEAKERGECASGNGSTAVVTALGNERPALEIDGSAFRVRAAQIGGKFWTGVISVLGKAS